jgi:hypothetical protein
MHANAVPRKVFQLLEDVRRRLVTDQHIAPLVVCRMHRNIQWTQVLLDNAAFLLTAQIRQGDIVSIEEREA